MKDQGGSLLMARLCPLKYSTKEDKYEEEIKLLEEKLKEVRDLPAPSLCSSHPSGQRLPVAGN
jgi:hypothetical protein